MRSFFYLLVLLLVVATGSVVSAQEIGLQLYSLRREIPKDVPGSLSLISSWGIREIEGGGSYNMTMDDYKALLKKNKLKMVSIGADFNELAKDPAKVVANAKAFGAKYVMCAWIPHKGTDFTLADTENAIEVFNRAGKVLAEAGITFCYHPHGYEFRPHDGGTLIDLMVKNVNMSAASP